MAHRREKGRISRARLYLRLLEYMLYSDTVEFTKYELMNKIPDLPSQRQDRISEILNSMMAAGHIEIILSRPNVTYYKLTEMGKNWYKEYGKEFLKFTSIL